MINRADTTGSTPPTDEPVRRKCIAVTTIAILVNCQSDQEPGQAAELDIHPPTALASFGNPAVMPWFSRMIFVAAS